VASSPLQNNRSSKLPSRSKHGSLAEFGPVLFVFLFFALFPMIDLMAVASGAATIALTARQAASAAASSADYATAINGMFREASGVSNSGLGKLVNLQPVGGYNNCGVDLWVVRTNIFNKQVMYCGPNSACPGPIDESSFVYEYQTFCQFKVGPLCNLGSVPFIGSVPGLGQPANITYLASAAVEHPNGISSGGAGGGGGGGGGGPGSWVKTPPGN
jgi:hypothetical protein